MVKPFKVDQVEEIKNTFNNNEIIVFVDYCGLDVEAVTDLRVQLRNENVVYKVYKNTLVKRAFEAAKVTKDADPILVGPTAFAFAKDPVGVSKVLSKFSKDNEALEIKGGIYNGSFLTPTEINTLASLPSREELLAKLVYMLQSPISGLVNVLHGPSRKFVYALNALKNQKG